MKREILVYSDWSDGINPILMGYLTSERLKGKEIFSFRYSREWLEQGYSFYIDPDLQFYSGPQFLEGDKSNFGIFLDSSPDRWGRVLMRRREAALARLENRKENTLFETDYLLGVYDNYRMGGIRFKENELGNFMNDDSERAAPPWTSLKELEFISLQLEKEDAVSEPNYMKWLTALIAPGSSLGGARPKASVMDDKKQLWIAKFPSHSDDHDIGGWEMVANQLALISGLNVAEGLMKQFSKKHHTFLSKRFDRTIDGNRIHFASAMTLLGLSDGYDHSDGISYLHLAELIIQRGAQVNQDLEELWRRIVFNICISNTDDHLRNHGFLLTPKGWILSPAYDINPSKDQSGLKLNISLNDNSLELDLALEVSKNFRINSHRAEQIVTEVKKSTSEWRNLANKYKISKSEQDLMSAAFRN